MEGSASPSNYENSNQCTDRRHSVRMEIGCPAAIEALTSRDPSGNVWKPMKDTKTGRVYWTNHTVQKTVWKPPQGCTHVQGSASPGSLTGWGQYAMLGHHHHSHPGHSTWHVWDLGANNSSCTDDRCILRAVDLQSCWTRTGTPQPTLRTTVTRRLTNHDGKGPCL